MWREPVSQVALPKKTVTKTRWPCTVSVPMQMAIEVVRHQLASSLGPAP